MFIDNKIFYAKTITGKIIEALIGFVFLLIALPFIILFFIGHLSKKLCDKIAKIEDDLIKKISKRGRECRSD